MRKRELVYEKIGTFIARKRELFLLLARKRELFL
jgi:hypothetical protein